MGDSTTIALNLTFFGTLGLAFVMFLGLFLLVVATLVMAGVGRLVTLMVMALFGRLPKDETLPLVRLTGQEGTPAYVPPPGSPTPAHDDGDAAAASSGKPARAAVLRAEAGTLWRTLTRRQPPVLAEDWAAAVAEADARAMARARAAASEIKSSARDLPDPGVPAETVVAVAPLVESALHQGQTEPDIPRSFTKPPAPAPLSVLDTGSLMSLSGHASVLKGKLPAERN